uniref:Uncharacterized protein n=1 Tax=Nelumbo nucifera TaxID=4432 RepID=A0A822XVY8_NELNU|nr:TPA_asm: hypothetical protein HUJ06_025615 [Nelumbo nucifera]
MAAVLFQFVFSAFCEVVSFASLLIFHGAAYLFVFLITVLRCPGQIINCVLTDYFKPLVKNSFDLAVGEMTSLAFTAFNNSKETFSSWASTNITCSNATQELQIILNDTICWVSNNFSEIGESFSEMVYLIAKNVWNNYVNAIGFVRQNV